MSEVAGSGTGLDEGSVDGEPVTDRGAAAWSVNVLVHLEKDSSLAIAVVFFSSHSVRTREAVQRLVGQVYLALPCLAHGPWTMDHQHDHRNVPGYEKTPGKNAGVHSGEELDVTNQNLRYLIAGSRNEPFLCGEPFTMRGRVLPAGQADVS